MEGVKIRARAKWIEEGEKNSIFFCSLENQNLISKSMNKPITSNNNNITDQTDIIVIN